MHEPGGLCALLAAIFATSDLLSVKVPVQLTRTNTRLPESEPGRVGTAYRAMFDEVLSAGCLREWFGVACAAVHQRPARVKTGLSTSSQALLSIEQASTSTSTDGMRTVPASIFGEHPRRFGQKQRGINIQYRGFTPSYWLIPSILLRLR